jgi:monofunctional biosynthetic peptidoglycan transglycosylase
VRLLRSARRRARPRRRWRTRLLGLAAKALLALVAATALPTACLRWVPPPTSSFMLQRRLAPPPGRSREVRYDWVPWERISPHAAVAVLASEDQRFPQHAGFDLESIADAVEERSRGGRLRGASTISQQVAKNLFLWPGRSFLRKGLEAWFAGLLELTWPKRRILEVYLNVAEFGDGVFGVEAASRRFFGKPAASLSPDEAARLAAVLPSPRRLRADHPSPWVLARSAWIQEQVALLGGPAYLRTL